MASWFACPLSLRSGEIIRPSFCSWFEEVMEVLDKEQLGIVVMVAWGIWNNRNGVIHDHGGSEPIKRMTMSLRLLEDFRSARDTPICSAGRSREAPRPKWLYPPNGVLKMNCDASVQLKDFVGIGFVIRDWRGKVLGAGVDRIMGDVGVDCTETMAIRGGLAFAREGHVDKLIVESDSKRVTDLLNAIAVDNSSYLMDIIEDRRRVASYFDEVSFSYVPRLCNKVAHGVASLAHSVDYYVPRFWFENIPSSISNLVVRDCY